VILKDRREAKTLVLIGFCYGVWGLLLFGPALLPIWITCILIIPVITFHSSLQHECIHNHPFQNNQANDLIASLPLGLFLPYLRYKETHLAHHQKASISDPSEDPESWYLTEANWQRRSAMGQALLKFNNTLFGRMLFGPAIGIMALLRSDIKSIQTGNHQLFYAWGSHLALSIFILMAIGYWGTISIGGYLICAYAGMSILMIRTFLEHQAHKSMRGRSVLIEDKGILSFLFLNNNLHAVHHAYPSLAWYHLPSVFRLNRDRFIQMNTGYVFENYRDIIQQYALKAKEPVVYPNSRKVIEHIPQ
jgi:fatty acid desaturase